MAESSRRSLAGDVRQTRIDSKTVASLRSYRASHCQETTHGGSALPALTPNAANICRLQPTSIGIFCSVLLTIFMVMPRK